MRSMEDLLNWRWGPGDQLGIGSALGVAMVAISVVAMALDMAKVTRQAQPPPWIGDTEADTVEACASLTDGLAIAGVSTTAWEVQGWPDWPVPELTTCTEPHGPAPDGVVRFRPCSGIRLQDGEAVPPCPPGRRSASYVRTRRVDGRAVVVGADIYVGESAPPCSPIHEVGHARGILLVDDDGIPFVDGAHTEAVGHVMGETCGDGWRWMDRREGGDWPY